MATNTIITPTKVLRRSLKVLHQKLTFVGSINRQYDDQFARDGAKIGDTLKIRMPNEYEVRTGAAMSVNNTVEKTQDLVVSTMKGVDVEFSSTELTLHIDDFTERIIEPAMSRLAAEIEMDALSMYKDVYNVVGGWGTIPADLETYLSAGEMLTDGLAPLNDRTIHLAPRGTTKIVNALKGLFQDPKEIARQYREGLMGRTAGFDWTQNTLMPTHTNGTQTVTGVQVDGPTQTGASLALKGVTSAATLTKGQVFTINGVFAVHPETKVVTDRLQQFVVTANKTFSGTSGQIIGISPEIIVSGARRTVSGSPTDEAALTFVGTASGAKQQYIAHQKDAFTFVTADLKMPKGVDWAVRDTFDGISMRIVRDYVISDDLFPCRIDVLYGYKALRPGWATRITT